MRHFSPQLRTVAKNIFTKTSIKNERPYLCKAEEESSETLLDYRDFIYDALFQLEHGIALSTWPRTPPSTMKLHTQETLLRIIQRHFSKASIVPSSTPADGFACSGLTLKDLKNDNRIARRQKFAEVSGLEDPWLREYCARALSNMSLKRIVEMMVPGKLGNGVTLGMLLMCIPQTKGLIDKWVKHVIPASENITNTHKEAHLAWREGRGVAVLNAYVVSVADFILRENISRKKKFGVMLLGHTSVQYVKNLVCNAAPPSPSLDSSSQFSEWLSLASHHEPLPAVDHPTTNTVEIIRRGRGRPKKTKTQMQAIIRARHTTAEPLVAKTRLALKRVAEQAELEESLTKRDSFGRLLLVAKRESLSPIARPGSDVSAMEARYVLQLGGKCSRSSIHYILDIYHQATPMARYNWRAWAEQQWLLGAGEEPTLLPGNDLNILLTVDELDDEAILTCEVRDEEEDALTTVYDDDQQEEAGGCDDMTTAYDQEALMQEEEPMFSYYYDELMSVLNDPLTPADVTTADADATATATAIADADATATATAMPEPALEEEEIFRHLSPVTDALEEDSLFSGVDWDNIFLTP
jgi:hypothetical protein